MSTQGRFFSFCSDWEVFYFFNRCAILTSIEELPRKWGFQSLPVSYPYHWGRFTETNLSGKVLVDAQRKPLISRVARFPPVLFCFLALKVFSSGFFLSILPHLADHRMGTGQEREHSVNFSAIAVPRRWNITKYSETPNEKFIKRSDSQPKFLLRMFRTLSEGEFEFLFQQLFARVALIFGLYCDHRCNIYLKCSGNFLSRLGNVKICNRWN